MRYLAHAFVPPPPPMLGRWDVGRIRVARDQHAEGQFDQSSMLAWSMLCDPRVFAANLQRIGPPLGIPRDVCAGSWRGGAGQAEAVRLEAEALFSDDSAAFPPGTLGATFTSNAMMGVNVDYLDWTPRADGSRWDPVVKAWPAHAMNWNASRRVYQAHTLTDGLVDVVHGDGKWILYEPYGPQSFRHGAVIPLASCFADRGYAVRDASNPSAAHGSPAIVGMLPESIKIDSDEGRMFMTMLQRLQNAQAGILKPFGSTVEFLEAKTLAWQIFEKIIGRNNQDIAMALLGQDGTSENGGGTYTKALVLDGVRYDIVKIDCRIAQPLNSGALKPWTAINFGDPRLQPSVRWLVPDLREQARRQALAEQHKSFNDTIAAYAGNGFAVDQAAADALAHDFGIRPLKLAGDRATPPAKPAPPGGKPPTDEQTLERAVS